MPSPIENPHVAVSDHLGVEVKRRIEISQTQPGAPFAAILIRVETRWYDNDPTPDEVEIVEASFAVDSDLPEAIDAVNVWLLLEHRSRVLPHSWRSRPSEGTTGVVLMFEGMTATAATPAELRSAPADRPTDGPPSRTRRTVMER